MSVNEAPAADVAVVGGGPAGLRAAEVASASGARVALFEANPFVGRKFLVAGKGGLNLTHGETLTNFIRRYRSSTHSENASEMETRSLWKSLIREFGPCELREWAAALGIETFQASTGRVYPTAMKAAPLLRSWIHRLQAAGVRFHLRHTLETLNPETGFSLKFSVPTGPSPEFHAKAVVLALGGASWPRTGSNAGWVPLLEKMAIPVAALTPANCGWECDWPAEVPQQCQGKPLKNVQVTAGGHSIRGELLVTRYGLEGGALYALSHILRQEDPPLISIDFKPDSTPESLLRRLGSARRNFLEEACARWRLDPAIQILLKHSKAADPAASARDVVHAVKNFPIHLSGPRPIAEAISSAGGVCLNAVDRSLMCRNFPGLFFAGEMLDWEAPTGGYLLQGCFATGSRAGRCAAQWALGTTSTRAPQSQCL
jgi:uncharacterized flavoprotein (TIGR03862 family)